jgi:hypothetical protein
MFYLETRYDWLVLFSCRFVSRKVQIIRSRVDASADLDVVAKRRI